MKIKGMRWGCDGGGFCCGPAPASSVVEVVFENGDRDIIVTTSVLDEFEHIWVTERSIFDVLIDLDFDVDELSENSIEEYDFDISAAGPEHVEDEFASSNYLNEIRFARFCMQSYYDFDDDPGQDEADAFIAAHIGKRAADYELPPYTYRIGQYLWQ